jgi:hypothetical protein
MDILKAKLRAGLIVKEYVPSFGDRPNTYAGTTTCASIPLYRDAYCSYAAIDFKEKFKAYHVFILFFTRSPSVNFYAMQKRGSPKPRSFFYYETTAVVSPSVTLALNSTQP